MPWSLTTGIQNATLRLLRNSVLEKMVARDFNEAYELWFEFLKRSDPYIACCDSDGRGKLSHLYADFGDVRQEWSDWWPAHRYLFEEEEPPFIVNVLSGSEQANPENDDDLLGLLVSLHHPHRTIMRELAILIRAHKQRFTEKTNKRILDENPASKVRSPFGAPPRDVSLKHRYALRYMSTSTIIALRLTLKVYDACKEQDSLPKKELKRYQIAEKLKICEAIPIDNVTGKRLVTEVNSASASISRYLRKAIKIIENVERGVFPDYSDSDPV